MCEHADLEPIFFGSYEEWHRESSWAYRCRVCASPFPLDEALTTIRTLGHKDETGDPPRPIDAELLDERFAVLLALYRQCEPRTTLQADGQVRDRCMFAGDVRYVGGLVLFPNALGRLEASCAGDELEEVLILATQYLGPIATPDEVLMALGRNGSHRAIGCLIQCLWLGGEKAGAALAAAGSKAHEQVCDALQHGANMNENQYGLFARAALGVLSETGNSRCTQAITEVLLDFPQEASEALKMIAKRSGYLFASQITPATSSRARNQSELPNTLTRDEFLSMNASRRFRLSNRLLERIRSDFARSQFGYHSFSDLDYDDTVMSTLFSMLKESGRIQTAGSSTFSLVHARPAGVDPRTESDDLQIVMSLAKDPSISAETLRFLNRKWYHFEESPRFLWGHFVLNPSCPGDILDEIARDTVNDMVRRQARAHRNFPR